ncbi:hypothetical protein VOLCADRAFT_100233 [Volvox carteri f. nagariensis]|uniref:Uncharacterized protein n=1 Tax=Volvox carteri f. nagariensis TaxID=3068 RepID=D8UJS1_VOLCA|nr:uncharacterized protein VOLCADRAFT_100233 [Volvox carteri f. nagariensis]EFJ40042.1 hypothetical protein VOLCADRAFT_100233 [Volvox carteri f. nagariensis]|eukprot:XP_002958911.1 hypothetical protein VOLCADRAFT_100233 [Volvox carteri f. nagariensis]
MAAAADPRLALMGGAPTQGNLRAVRARAQDLQKSIDEVIYGLRFNAGVLKWDDIIRKYSVINTQLAGLREAMRPGTLDGFALLPRQVPDPGFAEAVTVQLASALTPEGEVAAAEAAAAVEAALGLGPEMASMQRFEILNSAIEAHNGLIAALTGPSGAAAAAGGPGGGTDGPLSPLGPLRKRQRELSDITGAVLQGKVRAAAAAATALAAARSGPPAAAAATGSYTTRVCMWRVHITTSRVAIA